ncbi:MAG TPA: PTS fructose transporter subunit IIB [Anaerolineales bacterium]|nr:PTS fructose transporter subunit IIB [Anaerolineales bacterium]HNA56189.1 PTS fructose transporter subunit IIB [Anaerolineales bacterium]HNE70188.1 PTS fructose transporter subunit IIB [Anaerolineales bacterium]HNF36703.1 PTS fructose transporter subunit IIB [Anaerolineales bacterium]HNJ14040.1 PTS fructose transporter subunit IIB [Anaerolineales bacterium]
MKIVAITSCPTGIAHTYMAAEGLEKGAKQLGHIIKVETQGSIGVENRLTENEIAEAELVIIAADVKVDLSRFTGKKIYETASNAAIKDGVGVINAALNS